MEKFQVLILMFINCWYSPTATAQNTLGIRFTPKVNAAPYIENSSPGYVVGDKLVSFDAAVDLSHLSNKSGVVNARIDTGIVDWNIIIATPRNDFSTSTGDGLVNYSSNGENFMYQFNYSLSTAFVYTPKAAKDEGSRGSYRKSLFAEAFAYGLGISGNFDMRIKKDKNNGWGFRAGFGFGEYYNSIGAKSVNTVRRYVTFPIIANYILGVKRNGFETGIGFTPQIAFSKVAAGERSQDSYGTLNIGYRLQPVKDGLIVRATWAPNFDNKRFYPSWAGFSLGYSFK